MITPNSEDMKLADAIGAQCVRFPEHGDRGGYDLIQAARFIAMYREELTAKPAAAESTQKAVCTNCGERSRMEVRRDRDFHTVCSACGNFTTHTLTPDPL